MYGENTKYHSNPYIQGTTVPCDTCSVCVSVCVHHYHYVKCMYSSMHVVCILTGWRAEGCLLTAKVDSGLDNFLARTLTNLD